MNKYFYVFFLAISSTKEICTIFDTPLNPLIYFLHFIMLLYVLVLFIMGKLPSWVWTPGLSLVGISSLIFIFLSFTSLPEHPLVIMDAAFCLFVWHKSVKYLN